MEEVQNSLLLPRISDTHRKNIILLLQMTSEIDILYIREDFSQQININRISEYSVNLYMLVTGRHSNLCQILSFVYLTTF
jgi:hypothetical protein